MATQQHGGTHLLSAHFMRTVNLHGGWFASEKNVSLSAHRWEAQLARMQPQIGNVRLTIVHDDANLGNGGERTWRAIRLQYADAASLAAPAGVAACDLRWIAYEQLLEKLTTSGDCVMTVDVNDVNVIGDPMELCERYPSSILASSDSCAIGGARGVKAWLRGIAKMFYRKLCMETAGLVRNFFFLTPVEATKIHTSLMYDAKV